MTSYDVSIDDVSQEGSQCNTASENAVVQTTLSNCTTLYDTHKTDSGSVCSYDTETTTCLHNRRYEVWSDHDMFLLQLSSKRYNANTQLQAKHALNRTDAAIQKKRQRASKPIQTHTVSSRQQFCKKCKKPRLKGGHICDSRFL